MTIMKHILYIAITLIPQIATCQYWIPVGTGTNAFIVNTIALDSSSSNLFLGGNFFLAGGIPAQKIAVWDGMAYSAFGSGSDNSVKRLRIIDDTLYAGGEFTTMDTVTSSPCIARYNGVNWEPMGKGFFKSGAHTSLTTVNSIAKYNNQIYAGGVFDQADGLTCQFIARWDGSSWKPLGSGIPGANGIMDLEVFNGFLYVAGSFSAAGGLASTANIAKWDGSNWSSAGGGTNGSVFDLQVFNGELYAGGGFTTIGGTSANRTAKWNGFSWSALGTGMNADVNCLAVYEGELYAGGIFTTADGLTAGRVAKWDSTSWSPVGMGMNNLVIDLEPDEANNLLYACGSFTTADGLPASHVAALSQVAAIEESHASGFLAYPQPAEEKLVLKWSFQTRDAISCLIFDAAGRKILSRILPISNFVEFDIQYFAPGLYLAIIQSGQTSETVRFVKK